MEAHTELLHPHQSLCGLRQRPKTDDALNTIMPYLVNRKLNTADRVHRAGLVRIDSSDHPSSILYRLGRVERALLPRKSLEDFIREDQRTTHT